MKRKIFTFFLCIVFLLFLVKPPVLNAATPTTPTPTPVDSSSEVIDIRNGIPNQERSFNQQPVVVGPTPTIYVDVPGINPNMDDFKIPTMNHISDWLMKTIPYMSAKQIKDNLVTHDDNLFVSGKVKRCVWVGGILLGEPFTKQGEVYETNLIKYLADLLSSNRLLSSHLVRYSVTPIGDTYDLNGPAYRIDTTELPCELPGKGTLQNPPTKIGLKKGSGIAALIKWLESLVPVQITFTSKQQTAEAEVIYCTMAGCVKDREDADLEYVNTNPKNPPDEITRLEKSGGIVDAGFRAIFMDTKKKTVPHGQEQNFLDTNTLRTMQLENSEHLIKCSLVPPAQRGKVALANEDCTGFVENLPTTTSCDINLADLTVNPECKLKNNTFGLPANLITAIEAAASTFKVPASLLVGIIFGEGGFKSGSIYLNSNEMETYLDGCATLPNCDPNGANINNIVPFMQQYWPNLSDAIKVIDPNRTPNACNLLDGIFALAKDISKNQYGSPAFAGKTCFGIALNSGSGGSSSCNWSDSAAETAIRVWEFGTGWDNTKKSCATKLNSCYMGGGLAAQCPTGGDTCETVSNRYAQASHNACIWDIYKSN